MKGDYEGVANDFLELASEQRLAILLKLYNQRTKVSTIAKELGATVPEVYRNFERLAKADLIAKEADGSYDITIFGKIACSLIPSLRFLSNNKKYFKSHNFGDIPEKYLQRIGSLEGCEHVKGFVRVLEKWKDIHNNANEYLCNILLEVPYTADLVEPLVKKMKDGVKLRSILSESAIIPKGRKQIFDKLGFKKLIDEGKLERKMQKNVSTIIILNEKEALLMFPATNGEIDMGEGLFGDSDAFHEWCLDYFDDCWKKAGAFKELKLGMV
jgi:predicted transcriptional regulator